MDWYTAMVIAVVQLSNLLIVVGEQHSASLASEWSEVLTVDGVLKG